jgi:hypothetical protein
MKDYLDKVQASVSLPKNLLKRGSIEEMLSSQKLIDEKIEKLSNQQPENLAAVNDGSIQYAPDDIGKISVDEIVDEIVDKLGHVEGMCNLRYIIYRQYHRRNEGLPKYNGNLT